MRTRDCGWVKGIQWTCLWVIAAGPVFGQLGPCAVQKGPLLPDMIVDTQELKKTWQISAEDISSSSCALSEGCVPAAGKRRLLRFTSSTPNIGQADLHVGDPYRCLGRLFRFSECHGHLHFAEYADYRLWTPAGYQTWTQFRNWNQATSGHDNAKLLASLESSGALVVGRKQGFCLIDISRYLKDAPQPKYLSCASSQGITVGWSDEYHFQLDCQYIDITGVPAGRYILEDEVNPERLFPESDYTNNAAAVEIRIPDK